MKEKAMNLKNKYFLISLFKSDLRNEGVWELERLDDIVAVPILLRRNEGVGVPRVTRPTKYDGRINER